MRMPVLTEILFSSLSTDGPGTAASLYQRINKSGRTFSLKAIYNALAHLESEGRVAKRAKVYSARLCWLVNQIADLEKLCGRIIQKDLSLELQEIEGTRDTLRYRFRTLSDALPFETHMLTQLLMRSPSREMYDSLAHSWHFFVPHKIEDQFQAALHRLSVTVYRVVGAAGALDKARTAEWSRIKGKTVFVPDAPETVKNAYVTVIDDYIVEMRLPKPLHSEIDAIFAGSRQAAPGRVIELMHQDWGITLLISWNRVKAAARKKLVKNFLRVSEKNLPR